MRFLVRAEAVNLYGFLSDTKDLSTVRGGGLALLEAPRIIREHLTTRLSGGVGAAPKVEIISQGASVGLYEVEVGDEASLEQACNTVAHDLRDPSTVATNSSDREVLAALRHATFVIDAAPLGDGADALQEAIALATARNRWRQLQQASLVWPPGAKREKAAPCALDGVRPGNIEETGPDGASRFLSASTHARRWYGRSARQDLYRAVAGYQPPMGCRFANSLEELTRQGGPPQLQGKMAVVYIDGNEFGALVRQLQSLEACRHFDRELRSLQGKMLHEYLTQLAAGDSQAILRIETLLWGGDEVEWVLPAWDAWRIVEALLAFPFDLTINEGTSNAERVRLSFGIGLVLCHHNAPLRRIRSLARELADIAKHEGKSQLATGAEITPGEGYRRHHQSYVAYEVLESFDHLGTSAHSYRRRRADQEGVTVQQLLIPGDRLATDVALWRKLRRHVPGSVLANVWKARIGSVERLRAEEKAVAAVEQFVRDFPEEKIDVADVRSRYGSALWAHLADLRDYL